nr:hypothetical protein [Tanacetum cinerariifolium]
MREFVANGQADYYSGITSIIVNGKNDYELKGKFLNDLHKKAFNGTHEEDAVEHIRYFFKIVNLIDLPNVNQDKLRVVIFPISLAEDAWRCELKDEALRNKAIMKGLIDKDDESSNNGWRRWDGYEIADHD